MVDSVIVAPDDATDPASPSEAEGVAGDASSVAAADGGPRLAVGAGERQLRVVMHPVRGHVPQGVPESFLDGPRASAEACRRAGVRVEAWQDKPPAEGHQAVHVHWPALLADLSGSHAAERALACLAFLASVRRRGARVVWSPDPAREGLAAATASSAPEEPGHAARVLFDRGFLRLVSDVVLPTADSVAALRSRHPLLRDADWHVVPPVVDRALYPAPPSPLDARAALGLDPERPTVLHRGPLTSAAVGTFLKVAEPLVGAGVAVVIAGEVERAAYGTQLAREVAGLPGVLLVQGRMPVDEVPTFLAAADVVDAVTRAETPHLAAYPDDALPDECVATAEGGAERAGSVEPGSGAEPEDGGPVHAAASGSGQAGRDAEALAEAVRALGFGRPVVLTDTPDARLLAERVGPGWVQLVGDHALSHTEAVWAALEAAGRLSGQAPDLSAYTPEAMGAALARIYTGEAGTR